LSVWAEPSQREISLVLEKSPDPGQEGISITGAHLLGRDHLVNPANVADHLHPRPVQCPSTNCQQARRVHPLCFHYFQVMADGIAGRFEQGPVNVGSGVVEDQAKDQTARLGIVDRSTLTGEIGKSDQTI
jgi:hypothetical protein